MIGTCGSSEPTSPANTVTPVPVVVLVPAEVDTNGDVLFENPVVDGMLNESPTIPLIQDRASVSVTDLRVLVCVQVIAVSAAPIVSVLPTRPVVPVQAKVAL